METASDQAPAANATVERGADSSPLRIERERQGRTRKELAARVGMSANTLTGIENGHQRPALDVAERLADALGVDAANVFELIECECGCGEKLIDMPRFGSSARFLSGHNSRQPEHGASVTRGHQARRARLGIPESKVCERCGRVYTRSEVPNQSDAHWLSRKFCEGKCRWEVVLAKERKCDYCGELISQKVMARNHRRRFCSRRCGQLDRWKRLDIAVEALRALPPRARQVYLGRHSANKPPSPGGRPRGRQRVFVSDEQRVIIIGLAHQGWGRRAIATRLLLSERAVRNVLTDHDAT